MQEPDWTSVNEEELWKYVGWHLAKNGIESFLVGGAVVSIYSKGLYRSGDLDLITYEVVNNDVVRVLSSIGFEKSGMSFIHPKCKHLYVQLVQGPPGVGDDMSIAPAVVTVEGKGLKIYSPTDCIRDRLASYIHFRARDCLEQAVLVALKQPFNARKVKTWLAAEGRPDVYDEFQERLKAEKKNGR